MSAQAVIAAWLLSNPKEDHFTAGEEIVAELAKRGYVIVDAAATKDRRPIVPGTVQ